MNKSLQQVTSIKTAPQFTWGEACLGWWLKKAGSFSVVSETMPKSTSEIKHFHREVEQFFYVLEGTLTIEKDGIVYELQKEEAITIAPNTSHKVFNTSNQEVRFLVVSCPDSQRDRIDLE